MPEPRTITEAAEFIRRAELTPIELLEQCLARIDKYEPKVRAWVLVDRGGAREQAERLTAELKAGQNRGPLHGIPIGIKDIIDVFDLPTACGSKLWANSIARRDATVVQRLRQAGAVIMGKTVTTAFASFDPPVTRNPWNLERTPGGSSSGSAAAVACGMCLGALATQTGGSITRPAAYCGVCSLKVTFNRIQLDGVLPLAPSMDHMGCMANSVRDLAIIFQTIAGWDGRDTGTSAIVADYAALSDSAETNSPEGTACSWFGVPGNFFPGRTEAVMQSAYASVLSKLDGREPVAGKLGYREALTLPPGFSEVTERHLTVMAVEAAAFHEDRFRRHPDDYPPRISSLIERGLRTSAAEYARCKEHQRELSRERGAPFRILLTPATPSAAPLADTTGDPLFNSPWSYTGMPVISLPVNWSPEGLPLSVQVVAKHRLEHELFEECLWLEQAIGFAPRPLPL